MKIIETPISFQDERGTIRDLIENETINSITFVSFKPGVIRGNHYHKETFQYNYVLSGKIRIVSQLNEDSIKESILEKGNLSLTVPYEKHAMQAIDGDAELMVFIRGPRSGRDYESDTYRLENRLI